MQGRNQLIGLQFRDFILKLQLSPFHFSQFYSVLGGMRQFLGNFLVKRFVTLSERNQMSFT